MALLIQREPWRWLGTGDQRQLPAALGPGKVPGTCCTRE